MGQGQKGRVCGGVGGGGGSGGGGGGGGEGDNVLLDPSRVLFSEVKGIRVKSFGASPEPVSCILFTHTPSIAWSLLFTLWHDDDDDDDRFYISLFSALEQTHCARI